MYKYIYYCIFILIFTSCSNHSLENINFENALIDNNCTNEFFATYTTKINQNQDVIYNSLNVGTIARHCDDFNQSNYFFDAAEESYKVDVDLQGLAPKTGKVVASTLLNDNIFDYDGSLYERIMVNVYKGLNFMSLGDYQNARVEFNRALIRQDKAKDYFKKQTDKNQKEIEKAKEDPEYQKNMYNNTNVVNEHYSNLFDEFSTSKDFTNPYATYISSVFFFIDKDYRNAADKFREVAIINPKSKEFKLANEIFKKKANSIKDDGKRYIFLIYEDGFGTVKDEFSLTLPFIVSLKEPKIVTASVAFPTLKKREESYGSLSINGQKTVLVSNFDDIIATEFKIELPSIITKAIASMIVKTTINAVIANNDSTGGILTLASSIVTTVTTKADLRSWRGLPKSASMSMIVNKGYFKIETPQGFVLHEGTIDKNKNAIIWIRSFSTELPPQILIIEK